MKTTLRTYTIKELCEGFEYKVLEEKGLYGLNGTLTIQPEYQRNYLYDDGHRDIAVIDSVLKENPLGLLYFVRNADDSLEILDGQQRVTSLGRFLVGQFSVTFNGDKHNYMSLPADKRDLIDRTEILVYECEGTESEIKDWFQTINIAGLHLTPQELRNAAYSGPFVSAAKAVFSNSRNTNHAKWGAYVRGKVKRQEVLGVALEWVSAANGQSIDEYMAKHRHSDDISELVEYFTTVIDWAASVFSGDPLTEMKGVEWARLYETYKGQTYDAKQNTSDAKALLAQKKVIGRKSNVFEYVLEGKTDHKLLSIRFFDDTVKRQAYDVQTEKAKADGVSNCPFCAIGHTAKREFIYPLAQMEADHVTAWSKGGKSTLENCQMLCKPHNAAKGNA